MEAEASQGSPQAPTRSKNAPLLAHTGKDPEAFKAWAGVQVKVFSQTPQITPCLHLLFLLPATEECSRVQLSAFMEAETLSQGQHGQLEMLVRALYQLLHHGPLILASTQNPLRMTWASHLPSLKNLLNILR